MLQLYEEEMQDVIALVEGIKVTDSKVTDYLSGLKSIGDVYKKVCGGGERERIHGGETERE